ncbi:MAG: glycosyltransferase family 2 protein [Deltaproteobacteria bacterium]|nr:glycosyltransferase family 2 protein [Deltaproteobacteria bacterium]
MTDRTVSIVVSVFNEAEGLASFWRALDASLSSLPDERLEVLWVNDGSTDSSQRVIDELIATQASARVAHVTIELSRNFGHEAAMIAGIDHASGDAIVCMDADEQHPPDKLPEIVRAHREGADIVLMERLRRGDNGALKNLLSRAFYSLLNSLSVFEFQDNSTDFFLVSRRVSEVLRSNFRERTRFLRGFIQTIGFERRVLTFEAPPRAHGRSSYSYASLTKLALDAIFSFSNKPLLLSVLVSLAFVGFTFVFATYSLYMFITSKTIPSGYTTIVMFMSGSFSLLFILLTILSLYFERAIHEMRGRPIYIVKEKRSR